MCSVPPQFCHPAHHHLVPGREEPHRSPSISLLPAHRRHHQHGRDGAVRGRGGHLHRPGQRYLALHWKHNRHQVVINNHFMSLSFYILNSFYGIIQYLAKNSHSCFCGCAISNQSKDKRSYEKNSMFSFIIAICDFLLMTRYLM